jgi:salicylate hydroxylase
MGERRPFVIVGAGIGGLTTALALAGKGFRVVLVERAAEFSEIGAGIQLAPNAGRVLAGLGLDRAIGDAAIEPAAIDVMDGRGARRLTSIPGSTFRATYGFPYRVIHRADLQRILVAASDRIRIRTELGAAVESFVPQSGTLLVRIRKAAGMEVVPAEAVIAADGVWSSFRGRIPGAASAVPTGRTAWRAIIPADVAHDLMPVDRVRLWLGSRAHLVHYPVAQGAAVNVVAIIEETWDRKGWSAAGDAAELAARFAGWSAAARRIIAAPVAWQKYAIVAVDPSRPWGDDRLVLLGDAAHAMPPFLAQGAAMAIEDAAVIAEKLASNPDTPAALQAYVAERRPRVAEIAAASARTGERFHMRGLAGIARNLALRFAGERLIQRDSEAIYRWQPGRPAPSS